MSAPNQLSFLPDDYLETKRQRRTNAICASLFLVIMAAIGSAFTMIERSLREVERQHGDVDRQYTEAAKRIEQVRMMQEKQRKMANQAELTASLLEKVPRSFLLAELTNSMPTGVSLLDVTLESKLRQNNGAVPGGKTQFEMKRAAQDAAIGSGSLPGAGAHAKLYDVGVRFTGIADNDVQVAQFMSRLNRSKLLKDVNLVISDEFVFNEAKMRKFQIETTVDPAAEVATNSAPVKSAAVELK